MRACHNDEERGERAPRNSVLGVLPAASLKIMLLTIAGAAAAWQGPGALDHVAHSRVAARCRRSGVGKRSVASATGSQRSSWHAHASARRRWLQEAALATTAGLLPAPEIALAVSGVPTVLVTGASSGIGAATAEQLVASGYRVVLACRTEAKARAAAASLEQLVAAPDATPLCPRAAVDLGDLASVAVFAAEIKASVPRLDALVLCAGIDGAPETRTPQGNELHMSVNHLGHMLLAAELTPLLRRGGAAGEEGRVVSVTSSAALDVDAALLGDLAWRAHKYDKRQAYCLSKACNILFADALAAREAPAICSLSVDPGPTVTQIVRYEMPQRAKQRLGMTPSQMARQAKQLGFRTPAQAARAIASLSMRGDRTSETTDGDKLRRDGTGVTDVTVRSGGFYLGIAAPPESIGSVDACIHAYTHTHACMHVYTHTHAQTQHSHTYIHA